MYQRNIIEGTKTPQHGPPQSHYNKNYLNYINFNNQPQQKSQLQSPQREPEHVPLFNMNVNPRAQQRSGTPNSATINRNAYINPPQEVRRDPPKQNLTRNSSNKEYPPSKNSQEISFNKTQALKNFAKTSSQGFRINTDLNQSDNKPIQSQYTQLGSPNYSKTVDLGAVRYQEIDNSYCPSPEDDILKQKLNYLEVLDQSLRLFQKNRHPKDLKQLNDDNRQLMLTLFDEINKLKQDRDRSTKTISDMVSQSDNMSENGYGLEQSRNRLGSKPERRKQREGWSRSKQKDRGLGELDQEKKINQQLKQQYESELRRSNQKEVSQLQKLIASIKVQEKEIQKIKNFNKQIQSKLNFLPFYHEWQIMCGEAQGAKKTSIKIKEELAKRQERLKEFQRGSNQKNPIKSQETAANQLDEGRQGSSAKNKLPAMTTLKIPPSPLNRPNSLQNSSNRSIPDNSSSIKAGGNQNRSKSIHRVSSNN